MHVALACYFLFALLSTETFPPVISMILCKLPTVLGLLSLFSRQFPLLGLSHDLMASTFQQHILIFSPSSLKPSADKSICYFFPPQTDLFLCAIYFFTRFHDDISQSLLHLLVITRCTQYTEKR